MSITRIPRWVFGPYPLRSLRLLDLTVLAIGLMLPWRFLRPVDNGAPFPIYGLSQFAYRLGGILSPRFYANTANWSSTAGVLYFLGGIGALCLLSIALLSLARILKRTALDGRNWLWLSFIIAMSAGLSLLEGRCAPARMPLLSYFSCLSPGYYLVAIAVFMIIVTEGLALRAYYRVLERTQPVEDTQETKSEQFIYAGVLLAILGAIQTIFWFFENFQGTSSKPQADEWCLQALFSWFPTIPIGTCVIAEPVIFKSIISLLGLSLGILGLRIMSSGKDRTRWLGRLSRMLNLIVLIVVLVFVYLRVPLWPSW